MINEKTHNAFLAILIIIVLGFIFITNSCDSRLGKPDIRKEFKEGNKPDYFGWKWDFKW